MRLLAIETSEYVSSIALWGDGASPAGRGLLGEQSFSSRMSLCETLTARIQELLGGSPSLVGAVSRPRLSGSEEPSHSLLLEAGLDGLAISQGPGSFTGLRVGMATAKALAHVCGLPLVGVSTQQVLAAAAETEPGTVVCVLQKARQGHVYAGLWTKTEDGAQAAGPLAVVPMAELAGWLNGHSRLLIGPGAEAATDVLNDLPEGTRLQSTMPQARWVARLGAQSLAQADPAAAFNLQPSYVLPSQAERQKGLDLSSPSGQPASLPVSEPFLGSPASLPASGTAPTAADPGTPRLCLRRATLEDLDDVMRIERASFTSPWSEISIREELTGREGSLFLALELDEQIVGYVGAWLFAGEVHICTIAVDPARRRLGLGELLMLTILRHAAAHDIGYALLEYRVSNRPAETLYQKLGFEFIHRRKRYYQDNGEDAMVVVIADLGAPGRREVLDQLYRQWQERFPYEVSGDF